MSQYYLHDLHSNIIKKRSKVFFTTLGSQMLKNMLNSGYLKREQYSDEMRTGEASAITIVTLQFMFESMT